MGCFGNIYILQFLRICIIILFRPPIAYMQGYHTVLIYKICPYFPVVRLRNISVLISKKCPCL